MRHRFRDPVSNRGAVLFKESFDEFRTQRSWNEPVRTCAVMGEGLIRRFDRSAKSYSSAAYVQRQIAERLVRSVRIEHEPARVGDLGAGTGFALLEARKRFGAAELHGIEISPAMIERGIELLGHDVQVHWHCRDARELDALGKFDLLISSSSLQWMFPVEETLSSWRRAMQDGGVLALAVMVEGTLAALHSLRASVAPQKLPEQRFLSIDELTRFVEKAGIEVESMDVASFVHTAGSARDLLCDLRAQGVTGGKLSQGTALLTRQELTELMSRYDEACSRAGEVSAEYVVAFVYGRTPPR